jgi:hypothetical protein
MEWFINLRILVILAIVGAVTIVAIVGYALYKFFSHVRQSMLRHQKSETSLSPETSTDLEMSIFKNGTDTPVTTFPMTDEEFYSYMVNLTPDLTPPESILVQVKRESELYCDGSLLVDRLTDYEPVDVEIQTTLNGVPEKISLHGTPQDGEKDFRHIITSSRGDCWVIDVYDRGYVMKYHIEKVNPSLAKSLLEEIRKWDED